MAYKPLLFSTHMVQAIAAGRKTQTRRIIKPQPVLKEGAFIEPCQGFQNEFGVMIQLNDPIPRYEILQSFKHKYAVGDILWVRETWAPLVTGGGSAFDLYTYKSDDDGYDGKWKPSIFMPRAAARHFLKVTGVKAERLQDISEDDAIREGVEDFFAHDKSIGSTAYKNYAVTKQDLMENHWAHVADDAKHSFQTLWQSINGADSWDINPWVWVYEFERTEKPKNFLL